MKTAKTLFSINLALVSASLILFNLNANPLLISVLLLCLLIPASVSFYKIRAFVQNVERYSIKLTKLEKQMKHLEEQTKHFQEKESEYRNLIKELDLFIFTINKSNKKWLSSGTLHGANETSLKDMEQALHAIEEMLHDEDKITFVKRKKALLSGKAVNFQFRIVLPDGQTRWKKLRTDAIENSIGEVERVSGFIMDVTDSKEKEEKLEQMAFYDALTELPNRMMLKNHLQKALSRAKRKDHDVVIMFLDLDGFKNINDTLGHDVGDTLLKDVALRLSACAREEDMVSRIGGDEFIIVFEETDKEEVTVIAERILQNIGNPYYISDHEIFVTPSIGIATYPEDGLDINTVINHADTAMYAAKNAGKSRYQFYTVELEDYEHPKETLIDKFLKLFQK